jgi:hypothetical protein
MNMAIRNGDLIVLFLRSARNFMVIDPAEAGLARLLAMVRRKPSALPNL